MEERQTFDHPEMQLASGSVAMHCPGFPIIKPEHYNFFIYIYQISWSMQRDDFNQITYDGHKGDGLVVVTQFAVVRCTCAQDLRM
jgi:hypothetical protein